VVRAFKKDGIEDKMSRTVLFQHAYGEPWESLLARSLGWHSSYAARHGMEYVISHILCERHGFDMSSMSVLAAIQELDRLDDGDLLILIDTDALIVKPEVDLRAALPAHADLCLCGREWFSSSGVTIARNCAATRAFYARVLAEGPASESNEQIDARITLVRKATDCPARVKLIGDKWNWYDSYGAGPCRQPDCARDAAVVLAWHGVRDKRDVVAPLTTALEFAMKRAA
jgi:hypothetical protein